MRAESLGREGPSEEGVATHSSILAWFSIEEPGRLQALGLHRVGHNWSNSAHTRRLSWQQFLNNIVPDTTAVAAAASRTATSEKQSLAVLPTTTAPI